MGGTPPRRHSDAQALWVLPSPGFMAPAKHLESTISPCTVMVFQLDASGGAEDNGDCIILLSESGVDSNSSIESALRFKRYPLAWTVWPSSDAARFLALNLPSLTSSTVIGRPSWEWVS